MESISQKTPQAWVFCKRRYQDESLFQTYRSIRVDGTFSSLQGLMTNENLTLTAVELTLLRLVANGRNSIQIANEFASFDNSFPKAIRAVQHQKDELLLKLGFPGNIVPSIFVMQYCDEHGIDYSIPVRSPHLQ